MGDASRFAGVLREDREGASPIFIWRPKGLFLFSGAMSSCFPGSYSSSASPEMAGV